MPVSAGAVRFATCFARFYTRVGGAMDEGGLEEHRFPRARTPVSFHVRGQARPR